MKNKSMTQEQVRKIAIETAAATGMMVPSGVMVNSLLRAAGRA